MSAYDLDDHDDVPQLEVKKPSEEKKKKKQKKKDKDGNDIEEKDDIDAYQILGIKELGFDATAEEIKKAYRKLSLMYHPDKVAQLELDPDEADAKYKEIQEAYEILTTPERKMLFDSKPANLPKNFDRIPTGEEEGDFFSVYTEPFARFSRWSEVTPVPALGDASTPIAEVDAFYDFWYEFKSWRILTGNPKEEGDGEHDPSNAEDAYERRWMKTQNEAERKKLKKAHMKTIAELRDLAFKRDPRVSAAKAAEFAKADAVKQAKLEAKLKKEAEEKAIADAGKTPQELAKEKAALEKKAEEQAKVDAVKEAKAQEASDAESQAEKVKLAILARQKKAKEAAKGGKKKKK